MALHICITGSTGMIGKGVLLECLEDDRIEKVTLLNRSAVGIEHPKIQEVLLKDFTQIENVKDKLGKPDACFHCMGVSAVGLSEEAYTQVTYEVSKAIADTMYDLNPEMLFIYVSGAGTDSSEKGRMMWARVKGRTENYILQKGFSHSIMFRPGVIIPEKGIKSRTKGYRIMYAITSPLFPLFKLSKNVTTTTRIGVAMIRSISQPPHKQHVENVDINEMALGTAKDSV